MLNRLRTMEYAVKNSGWLMLDSVDALFKNAKDRIYNEKNGKLVCTDFYFKNNLSYCFRNLIMYISFLYRNKT